MADLSFTGYLTDDFGHIEFEFPREVRLLARSMHGKKLDIKVKVFRDTRSSRQNRYFHGIVIPHVRAWLAETQGIKYKPELVYMWIKDNVLGYKPKLVTIMGKEYFDMEEVSMSKMDTKEFAEAVDQIREYFLERGLDIPEPTGSNTLTEHYQKRFNSNG